MMINAIKKLFQKPQKQETMAQPRPNIYGFPHKGLRNGLGKLAFKLGATNVNNEQEVNEVVELAEELSVLLQLHLNAEEDYVLPPLEAKIPGSTTHNHEDHEEMERLEHEMMDAIRAMKSDPSIPALNIAYDKVNLFIREYYRHMSEEEGEMNKIIWENFTDEEILGWQGQILSKLTPEQFFSWFKYIIPSLQPHEQGIMLGGFKMNAPEEAYKGTIEGLKPFVTEAQFAHISSL